LAKRVHMKDMDSTKYVTFSMVRNPLERLVSRWVSAVVITTLQTRTLSIWRVLQWEHPSYWQLG
jgi:hypothetical protein